jgi:hypothetical protein
MFCWQSWPGVREKDSGVDGSDSVSEPVKEPHLGV